MILDVLTKHQPTFRKNCVVTVEQRWK